MTGGKRTGRWTLNDESNRIGEAGWHLDDGPIVLDWRPSCDEGCEPETPGDEHYDCCWVLYGFPGRMEAEPVDRWLPEAMRQIEEEWARDDRAWCPRPACPPDGIRHQAGRMPSRRSAHRAPEGDGPSLQQP